MASKMLVYPSIWPLPGFIQATIEPRLTSHSIVVGDVNGQLQPVFKKISTLHEKNKFSLAIVAGNLFFEDNDSVSDLLAGNISVPLPTYFTVGTTPLPQRIIDKIEKDEEVSVNLTLPSQLSDWDPTDLPQPPFSWKAKHDQDFRRYQDYYTWRTT